jgi:hypothetical protein
MRRQIAIVAVVALLGVGLAWAGSQPAVRQEREKPERVLKAEKALAEDLEKLKATHGQVIWIDAPAVAKAFPKDVFFAVRFRQFPVARILPEGLKASNVFVVPGGGKADRLPDARALQKFFHDHLEPVKADGPARTALIAWLSLAPEYVQDGFYKFEVLDKEIVMAGKAAEKDGVEEVLTREVTGRAIVKQGGNGEIGATLVFGEDGKLRDVRQKVKVRPGPRPICQATKLLDPDPLVRRMAEQDLLIMGLAARDYLQEQRARATPELQYAIDRLWRRIVDNAW